MITFNKIPFKRLPFVEYKVGDKIYSAVQLAATYRHFTEVGISAKERKGKLALTPAELKIDRETEGKLGKSGERIISDSFLNRWDGPNTITKKFSLVLYEATVNSKADKIHAVNTKHDPVIEDIRPYLTEPANALLLKKVHQKGVRKLIEEVNENKTVIEPQNPANGDLDFQSDQNKYDDMIHNVYHDSPAIIQPNHSMLDTIIEDDEDDDDKEIKKFSVTYTH